VTDCDRTTLVEQHVHPDSVRVIRVLRLGDQHRAYRATVGEVATEDPAVRA
jgi:hypothetical protein